MPATTFVEVFGARLVESVVVRTAFTSVLPSGAPVPTEGQIWPRGDGTATRVT